MTKQPDDDDKPELQIRRCRGCTGMTLRVVEVRTDAGAVEVGRCMKCDTAPCPNCNGITFEMTAAECKHCHGPLIRKP